MSGTIHNIFAYLLVLHRIIHRYSLIKCFHGIIHITNILANINTTLTP
jgi:hypothetical protein